MRHAKKKKLCDECGKGEATTTLSVGGVKVSKNGKELKIGKQKAQLCGDCTTNSMEELSRWLRSEASA